MQTSKSPTVRLGDTVDESLRTFFVNIFTLMALGLAITGAVTFYISQSEALMSSLFHVTQYVEDGKMKAGFGASGFWYFAALLQLAMVFGLCWRGLGSNMTKTTGMMLFGFYAALNGVTLAPVIYAYTSASVAEVFFITAATFAGFALWGYTTKTNLLPMRSFFMFALIGLIIALVVNMFFASPAMDYLVSGAAIVLFAGLTAYDMQKLRAMHDQRVGTYNGLVVYGALTLYLDFMNLFLNLLRFFGERK